MGNDNTDTGYAAEGWAFDKEVTRVFDNMLERSIPEYETMRRACFSTAMHYVENNTDITDLGCSRGGALADFVKAKGAYCRYIGVDVSEPMLEASRERFKGMIDCGQVDIRYCDLRKDYPPVSSSVTMAVLVLQFTPIEYRQKIIRNIFDHTVNGGCVILVEKILGSTADLDQLMVDIYYDRKKEKGYTQDEIDRKKLSLEGKLVPVTARWNEELLERAGFAEVECFWRWFNFAAWVAVKRYR